MDRRRHTACGGLHEDGDKQQIACTRSFGQPVLELHDLTQAVTEYASRAAEKLRRQGSLAGQVLVYLRTSPFRPDAQYSRTLVVPLRRPSQDSRVISQAATRGLEGIYRPGFRYAKAGVMLLDLSAAGVEQQELGLVDETKPSSVSQGKLMQTLDALNRRYGRGTLGLASAGLGGDERMWTMKQARRTPGYTTRWEELAVVRG